MNTTTVDILLIEDNHDEAGLTIRALKKSNLSSNLLYLDDGQDALDFLFTDNREMPKLILLDLKMPKVNGLEIIMKLKSEEKTRLIPIVVMISSMEQKESLETYKLDVSAYILKPMDFEQFVKAVVKAGLFLLLLDKLPFKLKSMVSWKKIKNIDMK